MTGWQDTVERVARSTPDKLALTSAGRAGLSYGGLLEQMDRCAVALQSYGIGRDTRVALLMPPGLEGAAALLSVMGHAIAVPLNPDTSPAELNKLLSRASVRAVIVPLEPSEQVRSIAAGLGLLVLGLRLIATSDTSNESRAVSTPCFDVDCLVPAATPWAIAANDDRTDSSASLILHTSGSTGEAKRVVLTQGQLAASSRNVATHLQLGSEDIGLNVMPLFHSHGLVGVLLSSLTAGGSVVLLDEGFEPRAFCRAVAAENPTWYSASPTIHINVLEHTALYREHAPNHRFRFVRSTSSALPQPILERLETALGAPVIESFGMTEWSQMASNPLPPARRRSGTVGHASGVDLALLQADATVLPLEPSGSEPREGELLVRGAGLAQGYDGDAAATAAAWTQGWFRSGDIARVDADGFLQIIGRQKDLINRGGEKISPLEIEAALLTHPAVHDAVACGVPHPTLGEDVAAVVSLQAGAVASESDLREHLFAALAAFKVPSAITILPAIARSATGKVNRADIAALIQPERIAAPAQPLTDRERDIAAIWCSVLKLERVGLDDNFFALGGDSLSGMRVIGRINKQLGIKLQPSMLFRHTTLRALAAHVSPQLPAPAAESLADRIAHLSDEEVLRLLAIEEQRAAERVTETSR